MTLTINEMIEKKLYHEIHTSGRKEFRNCRRKWDLVFRQRYYPKVTAKPLEFGSAFHKAMETFYNPDTWGKDHEVNGALATLDFIKMCEDQKAKAIEANNSQLDIEQEEDYAERIELGKGMLNYYFNEVSPKIDKGWVPIKVEIGFVVPIKNPETGEEAMWCTCAECWDKWAPYSLDNRLLSENQLPEPWKGLPVVYAGRLDMLAKDENGNYWIYDWKTAATISDRDDFLYLDDQVGSYPWALKKLGVNVVGFVYHQQRKDFPKPPKRNASVRLGRAFSVSKSEPVDYDSYYATVSVEDKVAYENGLYDEFLIYLQNEGVIFYRRSFITKSDKELESIERSIGQEVLDIISDDLRIYPSPTKFGCSYCAFQTPCMGMNNGEDFQYALDTMFEKKEHYYIRNEPSTESKDN